ncbi:MAG: hypothetical protein IJZ37_04015, partial [Clostridia bacterium]|nr:hypothetical protein [Clostridia bacterium]
YQPAGEEDLMTALEIQAELQKVSKEIMDKINNCEGKNDAGEECTIEEYIDELQKGLGTSEAYKMAIQGYKVVEEGKYDGPSYEAMPYPQYCWFYFLVYHGEGKYYAA